MLNDKNMYLNDLKAWLSETEDTPLEEMDAFFTARLDGYEAHMSVWREAYRRFAAELPTGLSRVLDLGCGTGLELDEIFPRFPALEVTGVDLSASMLKRLLEKHDGRALKTVCGSYFDVPFGADFDAVISFESLHHFTAAEKLPLFRKIRGALRPGGVFMNCDYFACCDEEETLLRETCGRRRMASRLPADAFVHFDTPLTVAHEAAALRAAGFSDVRAVWCIENATLLTAVY